MQTEIRPYTLVRIYEERSILERLAKEDDRSMSSMVRELIRREAKRRLVKHPGGL